MKDYWKEKLLCATECSRCRNPLKAQDDRILSCYDHEPICMKCKHKEEKRRDYEEASRAMIGQCLTDTELIQSDPGGYCYSHFYPYKCE